ncbi:Swt1 family HEPN domain-containing protein [Massilia sp. TS11]|uniref:Swt1 family HEPN domain-containing protein n=1 Tax=Massilia sp. TS11 TaxID=2908003 RepID=UPI001EDA6287|nr:Swt1 family HEPN domain-containing protein [Massilia sp. TS11]MCG2583910.1 Swt1 family HEPN domain-containing protein [Massilia sp. TS11]
MQASDLFKSLHDGQAVREIERIYAAQSAVEAMCRAAGVNNAEELFSLSERAAGAGQLHSRTSAVSDFLVEREKMRISEIERALGGQTAQAIFSVQASAASQVGIESLNQWLARSFVGDVGASALRDLDRNWSQLVQDDRWNAIGQVAQTLSLSDGYGTSVAAALARQQLERERFAQRVLGATELTVMAQGVARLAPFLESVSTLMRAELGDFSSWTDWSVFATADGAERSAIYSEQGFSPALSSVPADEVADVLLSEKPDSGLVRLDSPLPVELFLRAKDDDERMVLANKCLKALELELRAFIEREMRRVFGANWMKTHLSQKLILGWKEKAEIEAKNLGRPPAPLMDYADFTEYEVIITGNAAWEKVFKRHFRVKEDVKAAFYRLRPLRVATAHHRILLNEEVAILAFEGTRLMRQMRAPLIDITDT